MHWGPSLANRVLDVFQRHFWSSNAKPFQNEPVRAPLCPTKESLVLWVSLWQISQNPDRQILLISESSCTAIQKHSGVLTVWEVTLGARSQRAVLSYIETSVTKQLAFLRSPFWGSETLVSFVWAALKCWGPWKEGAPHPSPPFPIRITWLPWYLSRSTWWQGVDLGRHKSLSPKLPSVAHSPLPNKAGVAVQ